ncbi:hypothetical protein [Streptomyces diastatochromogenes]|uniref:hypothetical protein n=1 Tax=Streptomyces diastatochromogenes TaxID=42236 RepID=UPI0036A76455
MHSEDVKSLLARCGVLLLVLLQRVLTVRELVVDTRPSAGIIVLQPLPLTG